MRVLVTFIVLMGIALIFIMSRNLDYRSELCTDKKGMMVRTEKGWKCLDVKELQ
jgi:hypothetical protein